MADIAINIDKVYKDFKLPHQRKDTIKSIFTGVFEKSRNTKNFEVQKALQDISFDIKKGEFFGIVGRNGSGKSTLLKILAGIYQPTKGNIAVKGKLVPFIELGVGFNPELTGRENVYLNGALLGFTKSQIDSMYDEIVSFAELERFMDQKLKNYSSGMQVRLAFSMAIRAEADVLLIDEVLAVGDAAFQRKCLDYFKELKRAETTVVFVSHDMGSVQQYCDRAVLIENSEIIDLGKPSVIASKYHKMFVEEAKKEDAKKSQKIPEKNISGEERWGDGKAEIVSVKAIIDNPTSKDGGGEVTITSKIKALADIEKPIVGFSIKNLQLAQLMGTNTLRKKHDMQSMKKGSTCEVRWKIANMFNEGTYYIDATVAYEEATNVADRWPDSTFFKVYREDNTPYQVYPEIKVHTEYSKD